ncbi:MAG: hypothetical protein HY275_18405, partial [Gemmatimonadetes bacterium]|nr:hypothetical protein [Gemmatimonadota bacterium]
MDAAAVERVFVDDGGRLHWPFRLGVFVLFTIGALITLTALAYPAVAAALDVVGVRLIAWPWLSLGAVAAAHWLMKTQADKTLAWADVGLTRADARPALMAGGLALGAGAIVVPSLLLVLVGWLAFLPESAGDWGTLVSTALLVLAPAALHEELLFRGYGFTVLRERLGWAGAIAVTSV